MKLSDGVFAGGRRAIARAMTRLSNREPLAVQMFSEMVEPLGDH